MSNTDSNVIEKGSSLNRAVNKSRLLSLTFAVAVLIYICLSVGQIIFSDGFPRGFTATTIDDSIISTLIFLAATALAISPALSKFLVKKTAAKLKSENSFDGGKLYFKSVIIKTILQSTAVFFSFLAYYLTRDISFCMAVGLISVIYVISDFPSNSKAEELVRAIDI